MPSQRLCITYSNPQPTIPPTTTQSIPPTPPILLPPPLLPGTSFATVAVAPAVTRLQLAVPHPYPLGQHPAFSPPSSFPHRNQPVAQLPAADVPGTPLAGTATVTPSVSTIVVEDAGGGQEVVWQSRPVWQQPPPAVARQG